MNEGHIDDVEKGLNQDMCRSNQNFYRNTKRTFAAIRQG